MSLFRLLISCALLSTLGGCAMAAAPVSGFIYTETQYGDQATGESVGMKSGQACSTSILGAVALGDATVDAAAKAGGISKVSHVDHTSKSIIGVYAEFCTVVYGN